MYTKITAKEVALKLNISERSARTLINDIKEELEIKIVCEFHLSQYLKIPHAQSVC